MTLFHGALSNRSSPRLPRIPRRCSTACMARSRSRASWRGRTACSRRCATPRSAAASACVRSWWSTSAALFDVPRERALMVGAALECVHCYSLVHDDLPAMDDDDLRRGQPTAHKKFDEATAILAGDGLLTFAFDILARARDASRCGGAHRAGHGAGRAARASAAWSAGRCSTSRPKAASADGKPPVSSTRRERCDLAGDEDRRAAALRLRRGRHPRRRQAPKRAALDRYGDIVGKAFQIADDLLDVEGDRGDARQGGRQGCRAPARRRWSRYSASRRPKRGSSAGGRRRGLAQAVRRARSDTGRGGAVRRGAQDVITRVAAVASKSARMRSPER